jgi:hypothetical protein
LFIVNNKFLVSILDGIKCNFEKDTCGWTIALGSNVNWIRKTGLDLVGPYIDQYDLIN